TMTNNGSGYTSAPSVTFSPPPAGDGGVTATGTAVLGSGVTAGQVVSVTVTNPGSGYSAPPIITFTGGGFTTQAVASSVLGAEVALGTIPSSGSGWSAPSS